MNKFKINLPLLVILSGVIFSLYLLSQVPNHLYFSGDGGLKALLAQQLASGDLRFDLNLQVSQWVDNLWNNGLYPFEAPFSYKIDGLYYITFPFTFPLVTAPFYALFGNRGLYIIPLVSTWIVWFNFYRLCRTFQINNIITSIGLITLIFASPLTIYSALYWEHTLAVCLAFSGLVGIFTHKDKYFPKISAIFSGILIGLSVWFRPEFLVLVAILFILVIPSLIIKIKLITIMKNRQIIFTASLILTVLCFFALNQAIYGHPLGAHSFQVVEDFALQERLLKSWKFFNVLKDKLLEYFPTLYFAMGIAVIAAWKANLRLKIEIVQILVITVLYVLIVPILLPSDGGKQWGPRFLLFVIPLITVIAISNLEKIWKIKRFGIRYIAIGIFTALFVLGFNLNILQGTEKIYQQDKETNLETYNFLINNSNQFIAVDNQYVGQFFVDMFNEKTFFLTPEADDIKKLGVALNQQKINKFLYVCPVFDKCYSDPNIPNQLEISGQENLTIQFQQVQKNKRYRIEEATISQG
jgi:hypothetical protein